MTYYRATPAGPVAFTPEETVAWEAELAERAAAVIVPQTVTRRQARQALLLNGFLDTVPTLIAAIPNATQRGLAQIEWEDSQVFERQRPLVLTIGAALGLNSAALDALFIQAAGL